MKKTKACQKDFWSLIMLTERRLVLLSGPSGKLVKNNFNKDTPSWLQKLLSFRYQKPNQIPIEGTVSNPEFEPNQISATLDPSRLRTGQATILVLVFDNVFWSELVVSFVSTLQHEAHGSDVEEEKRRRVVNKNFKTMRLANAETKKNIRRFL